MLDELMVSNLGIIDDARVEPGPGLVVFTGETGAGKTLLLGALRLLVGGQARRDLVGPRGDEATVAGRFSVHGVELVVARRITAQGRSRAYLDGMMTPLRTLEERVGGVVEIVAQNDHLRLSRPGHVREMVDAALDDAGRRAKAAYAVAWEEAESLRLRMGRLGGDRRSLERDLESARFQAADISSAGFAAGDDEALVRLAGRLRNARALVDALQDAAVALGPEGVEAPLDRAVRALERAAALDSGFAPVAAQAADMSSLLSDLRADTGGAAADVEHESADLEEVEERLSVLNDLRRKYGDSLDDVLAFGVAAAERAAELGRMLAEADTIAAAATLSREALENASQALSAARRQAANRFSEAALAHLRELGFRDPALTITLGPATPGPHGADRVELLFASDVSLDPGPVGRIASGGELSRLVLALRLAGGVGEAPVAAFDEIDAGVGGTVALALGRKLARLAERCQVLCVTHLPQVAAFADTHVVVTREGTRTTVRPIEGEDRLEELSRMLAGMPESRRGRRHAAELLEAAGRR